MGSAMDHLEELKLVADIFDTLSKSELRPDHVNPLTARMRRAIGALTDLNLEKKSQGSKECGENERPRRTDGLPEVPLHKKMSFGLHMSLPPAKLKLTKPSSIGAFPVPREKAPRSQLAVSKEVSRCLCCVLYNLLEGVTTTLQASSAHIFVRKDDEMVSIGNCSAKLSFPPQLVRQRCLGSLDADVLASGIALNQEITDLSKTISSLLIFPIFTSEMTTSSAIATIHVENKIQGTAAFNGADEGVLLAAAKLIGGLMARFPQMDWMKNFYDPVTQHILSPFVPRKRVHMPGTKSYEQQSFLTEMHPDVNSSIDPTYFRKIEEHVFSPMIRREVLPRLASQKPPAHGLSAAPSLREVDAYVENMLSCWKRNLTSNVSLSEEKNDDQIELRKMRRELIRMRALYKEAEEQLRVYRLESHDYVHEFRNIKSELDAYLRKRDKLDA